MPDDRSPSHDDRIAQLEAEVRRLTELADRSPEREAVACAARQPRLAITCPESSTRTSPSQSCAPFHRGCVTGSGATTSTS